MQRPSKDEYFLNMAREAATRSTCLRSKYGTVIVKRSKIKSAGYNGSAKDTPNCCDLGYCSRDMTGTRRYNACRGVHSELNAMLLCNGEDMIGSTLYIARHPSSVSPSISEVSPCASCRRLILNAEIKRVVCLQDNGDVLDLNPKDWIKEL